MKRNRNSGRKKQPNRLVRMLIGGGSIRRQLYKTYFLALGLPIALLGIYLVSNTGKLLRNYHLDMVRADAMRINAILFEVTEQAFHLSESMCLDGDIQEILRGEFETPAECRIAIDKLQRKNLYRSYYSEINEVSFYSENPTIEDYGIVRKVTPDIAQQSWYQQARRSAEVFWHPISHEDEYGTSYWELCLVRRVSVYNSPYDAVLVIRVSDNYLRMRIEKNQYDTVVCDASGIVGYATNRERYGTAIGDSIALEELDEGFLGEQQVDDRKAFVSILTTTPYQSNSGLYIISGNYQAHSEMGDITRNCILIILTALLLPAGMIFVYTNYLTKRVDTLRNEMHKASTGDYEIVQDLHGKDELSEAFSDLKVMVEKIQESDALRYQAQLTEQELKNKQQEMEFKMLASQINPHFLYNTLETIRMNAFTAGNRQVATSIKLLGKSLRYVLDNTGTQITTLQKELDYIDNYIKILQLRFGERVRYHVEIEEGIHPEQIGMLPLLLQPVVENSILHGLAPKENGGSLSIRITKESESCLLIRITDDGVGMDRSQTEYVQRSLSQRMPDSGGIGLYNINQRIRLSCGEPYGMEIESRLGAGTSVSIRLPLAKDEAEQKTEV